ncbi:DMT family transporter [Acidocella sp. KAb 2-4]|uniref:DMT family transporter n=1 Tax=Acidocella sp. KAb 2-4 TaxID=2885158 RepID=UPI001D063CEB|nr:EamA family transporter [Acidocella sp. KAb 2-4]MCB5944443.1 DMT family transporter [Acidocella sp. KAb 2-4]
MISRLQAFALIFLAVMLWGWAPVGTRYMLGNDHAALPWAAFTGLRYGLAAFCFLPWLLRALRRWPRRELMFAAFCGLTGVTSYNLAYAFGSRTVSAGMVGLITATEPLLIVLLISLRNRRLPGGWTVLAGLTGFAGIALLAGSAGPAQGDWLGMALVLFAAFTWAWYCVLTPPLLAGRPAVEVSAVTMTGGGVPLLLAGARQMPHLLTQMDPPRWAIVLGLVFGPSVLAMVAWNKGTSALGPEASGWFLYLLPLVALGGGALLLGEKLTLMELAGGVLILLSVFLSQRAPARV